MSALERAARGVLLAGFEGTQIPPWVGEQLAAGLGGLCLYGKNTAPERDLADLAARVRDLAPSAVLAVDEEGGDVTRLHTRDGSPYAGACVLGALDSPSVTRAVAEGIGTELAAAGIWLDLAPCADVNSDPLNPVIGTRSFGADATTVSRHTAAFIEGLAAAGVAASVKHYPGHGDTRTDSHHALPTVRADRATVRERDLAPFTAAVAAGAATVMTSHVVIEAIDAQNPATFSSTLLREVLRGELGFTGVIVTDALDMAGAQAEGPWGSGLTGAAVRALAAGADLLCLGPGTADGVDPVSEVVREILAAVADGRLPAERLLEAADRADRLRATWAGQRGATPQPEAIERARRASDEAAAAVIGAVPPMPQCPVLHLETTSSPAIGATAWGLPVPDSRRLTAADLAATPIPEGPVLLAVRGATRQADVWDWICRVMSHNDRARLAELGWPDPQLTDQPWSERVIRTYGASAASTRALSRALGWGP